MEQINPYALFFTAKEGTLEQLPCSVLALGMVLLDYKIPNAKDMNVKFDEQGYCKLQDMTNAIKDFFVIKKYNYYQKKDRKNLGDFTKFPGNYIVCVKGHYIYVKDTKYYSFFDNNNDQVIAYWLLERK